MTAFDNFKIAHVLGFFSFSGLLLELGPAIISQRGNVRQTGEHVDFRQRQRGLPDALGFGRNRGTQVGKQPPLDFYNLLLGIENLRLILLQLRSRETLGIHQRLLALVIGGREVQVRFRNLNVVAEDGIELHLERPNSRPLALARLNSRQVLLRVAAQIAQFVEIFVNAGGDHSAIA